MVQFAAGDAFAQLHTPQLPVGIGQFGDQADLQLLQVGYRCFALGIAGFQRPLHAAEQVDFPDHVQAEVVALGVDAVLGDPRHLALADIGGGAAGDGGEAVVGHVVADRPRGAQAGVGHAQLAVLLQRLLHQLLQHRVVELLPPGVLEATAVVVACRRFDLRRRGLRRLVVRTHGTGAERQCQQGGGEKLHAWASGEWAMWRWAFFSARSSITRRISR
ncbi:hypothetical protein D3C81_1281240 [compost metagenome]